GSLEVVDLVKGERTMSIGGLKEPQGVAFVTTYKAPCIAVACGGDGTLHLYNAATLNEKIHVTAGDDADNLRFDENDHHLWVGVGDGALAAFDASTLKKIMEIPLKG